MAFDVGFNFRATSGYVTDPSGSTFDLGAVYPRAVTVNGASCTVGWTVSQTGTARDRSLAVDARLAGTVRGGASNAATWRCTMPEGGALSLHIAFGDATTSSAHDFDVLDSDGTTVLFSVRQSVQSGGAYTDANGTTHASAAAWVTNSTARSVTVSGVDLYIRTLGATNAEPLSHVRIVKSGGSSPADVPPGTFDVTGVPGGWFDETGGAQGWFDRDLLDVPASSGVNANAALVDAADTLASTLTVSAAGLLANAALVDSDDVLAATASVVVRANAALLDAQDVIASTLTVGIRANAALVDSNDTATIDGDVLSTASLNAVDATDGLSATLSLQLRANAALNDDADVIASALSIASLGAVVANASLVDANDALSASFTKSVGANASLVDGNDALSGTLRANIGVNAALVDGNDTATVDADISSTASLNAVDATDVLSATLGVRVAANASLNDGDDSLAATLSIIGGIVLRALLVDEDDWIASELLLGNAPDAGVSGGHVDTAPRPRPKPANVARAIVEGKKPAIDYVERLKADLERSRQSVDALRVQADEARNERESRARADKAKAKARRAKREALSLADQLAQVQAQIAAEQEYEAALVVAQLEYEQTLILLEEIDIAYVACVLCEA